MAYAYVPNLYKLWIFHISSLRQIQSLCQIILSLQRCLYIWAQIWYIPPMCNNEYSYESCQGGYKRNYIILFSPFSCLMRFSSNWPHRDKSSLVEACYLICQDWFNCSSSEAAASSLSSACSLTHCRKGGPYPGLRQWRSAFTSPMRKMVPFLLISTEWNIVLWKAKKPSDAGKEVLQCLSKCEGAWKMLTWRNACAKSCGSHHR